MYKYVPDDDLMKSKRRRVTFIKATMWHTNSLGARQEAVPTRLPLQQDIQLYITGAEAQG
jgi:hypothetical protein